MDIGTIPSTALRPLVSPVIVGRDAELSALLGAATSPPSLIVVEGEAGVGKSRLVSELLRAPELAAHRRLVGSAQQLHEPFRFAPLVQAVRGAGPLHESHLPRATGALRALLPELDQLPQPPRELFGGHIIERHLLFRGVMDLLNALGQTVLVLEDVHWADPETVDLIQFIAAQLPRGLVLILTYRREEVPPGSPLLAVAARIAPGATGGKIVLRPLSTADVTALLAAILGSGGVSEEFAAFVREKTGGVPFAVEEMLRLMIDRGEVVSHHGQWIRRGLDRIGVPTAIRDSVLQRSSALPAHAQSLAETAAVVDAGVSAPTLFCIAELDGADARAALREALSSGLLTEDAEGQIRFRHELARDALYESIPYAERQQLHRRVAGVLESSGAFPLATIAHHLRSAGEQRWMTVAMQAADAAAATRDYEAAVRLLADALGSGGLPPDQRFRVAATLGWAAYRGMVREPRVVALLGVVMQDSDLTRAQRGELRFLRGFLIALTGDASAAHEAWRLAVDELGTSPLAARVMIVLADPWVFEGTLEEHMGWLHHATEVAAEHPSDDVALAVAVARATTLLYVGDPRGREAAAALELERSSGEERRLRLWAHVDFAAAAFNLGRYTESEQYLTGVRRHATHRDSEILDMPLRTGDLMLDWATARWGELDERAARHAQESAGVPRWSLPGTLIAASLATARGDHAVAERLSRGCLAQARAGGVVPAFTFASGLLTRVHLDRGRAPQAAEDAVRGIEPLQAKGLWVWAHTVVPVGVEALLESDRAGEAEELVRAVERGLTGRDAPAALAAAQMCNGILAEHAKRHEEAAASYADADRQFAALPHPWFAAQARAQCGVCLLRSEHVEGEGKLDDALAVLTELGATADINRIHRALRRHGIPVRARWRSNRTKYGGALSPRESQVMRLAADGLTNPEIGRLIFLSPRTVEHHLASAMHKLGVRSRIELAKRGRDRDD